MDRMFEVIAEAADVLDAQRRAYLMGYSPECKTCGAELVEATMHVAVYGPTLYECEGYCSEQCADNFDGGAA